MRKPTQEDANLRIQLLRWGAAEGIQDAMNWVWSDEFITDYDKFVTRYPRGSEQYGKATKVCGWFESIGTLYKQDLISGELLFDSHPRRGPGPKKKEPSQSPEGPGSLVVWSSS